MKALGALLALLVGMAAVAGPAAAGEVLTPTTFAPNPFAMTPPPAPLTPRPAAPVRPPHPHRPPVAVSPCCAPSGYWAYQWVPTAYTTYVWVPGYVAADGTMVAGGYQPHVVTGGYYQPVWVGY
ncbi:MAG TPA: hypothetical protein VFE48_04725 [Methylomirabilota bacterium]|jgi:hypothetical protein|nr:hypothetical protein [Methylomirabilota bacterium]